MDSGRRSKLLGSGPRCSSDLLDSAISRLVLSGSGKNSIGRTASLNTRGPSNSRSTSEPRSTSVAAAVAGSSNCYWMQDSRPKDWISQRRCFAALKRDTTTKPFIKRISALGHSRRNTISFPPGIASGMPLWKVTNRSSQSCVVLWNQTAFSSSPPEAWISPERAPILFWGNLSIKPPPRRLRR